MMRGASVPEAQEQRNDNMPIHHDEGFSRSVRIVRSAVFREAFEQKVNEVGRFMVVWVRNGDDASSRLGVIASKRTFRRAVDRARAKRLIREAFRLNRGNFVDGYDYVIVARHRILGVSRQIVEKDLMRLIGRLKLLSKNEQ